MSRTKQYLYYAMHKYLYNLKLARRSDVGKQDHKRTKPTVGNDTTTPALYVSIGVRHTIMFFEVREGVNNDSSDKKVHLL